jgi:feruloyl esterase
MLAVFAASALGGSAVITASLAADAAQTVPGSGIQQNCQTLPQLLRSDRVSISSSQPVAAGPLARERGMPPAPPLQLPAHCLLRGALEHRTGVQGRPYEIGFEIRLPMQWNGRLLFQGGGGLDGVVRPAVGEVGAGSPPALARGFAVVSTDSGHQGLNASFGFDQQARIDFAYASIGKVEEEARHVLDVFYGRPARYSYFAGCSNGGREGMMAAERFPDLFDGVVAGDPGFHLTAAAVGEMWDTQHFERIAPHDAQGHPILSQALSVEDLQLLSGAVLRQCDALDGLADGMVNNVGACHFNPAVLRCHNGQSHGCLSTAKVDALQAVFAGAHDAAGRQLSPSWPYDGGLAGAGWRAWKLGTSDSARPNAINATLGLNAVQDYFLTPPRPSLRVSEFDFNRDPAQLAQTAAINDATSTFLTSFATRGGRLLIYQGVSDPVFSANDIIAWYRTLLQQDSAAAQWARLFLIPGMNHCMGGPATDRFDALTAIQAWTEHGQPPDRLLASSGQLSGITRPPCPWPRYAHYRAGDPHAAASFECR